MQKNKNSPDIRSSKKPASKIKPHMPPKKVPLNQNLLIGSLLFLATIIYYWPVVSLSGTIWNDFIEQYLPYRIFATRMLKSFTFPFWNPYSFSGMPFFADLQSAVLYPFNLLLVIFSNTNSTNTVLYEYQIVLHIFLSGIFSFFLARDFKRSRYASMITALTFMFGGFTTTHIFHVTMVHGLPWIPLSLLFLRRALLQGSLLYTAACGLVLSFISFAGHPQMILYTHYFLGSYLLYHLFEQWKNTPSFKKFFKPIMLFLLIVILETGLSAVQLLPVVNLSKESVRPQMSFNQASEGSFRPYRLITMIVPNYFGIPNKQGTQTIPYWGLTTNDIDPGPHYYWETSLYIGIIPLFFSIAALLVVHTSPVVFLSIVSFVCFLLALGESGGIYHLFYTIMPGFKMFRNPARIAVILSLSSSICAAFGFDWFLANLKKISVKGNRNLLFICSTVAGVFLLTGILFSAGLFAENISTFIIKQNILGNDAAQISQYVNRTIYPFVTTQVWLAVLFILLFSGTFLASAKGFIKPSWAAPVLVLLTLIDFLTFGYGFATNKTDPRRIYTSNDLIKSIRSEYKKELFRINSRNSAPGRDDISGGQMIFKRNEGTVHELFLMEGYNPLRLKRQLLDRKDKTLDILNVRYKIETDNASGRTGIAPHPTAFSRAWFAHAYIMQPDENKILPDLYSPSFNHRSTIILEEQPDFPSGNPDIPVVSTVSITSWGINKIVTEVSNEQPGFLVLSEIYYPAWKARVDGKPVKLYRADYALRAIPVSAGKHTVICEYQDNSFSKGLYITLVSAALTIAVAIIGFVSQKKRIVKQENK